MQRGLLLMWLDEKLQGQSEMFEGFMLIFTEHVTSPRDREKMLTWIYWEIAHKAKPRINTPNALFFTLDFPSF